MHMEGESVEAERDVKHGDQELLVIGISVQVKARRKATQNGQDCRHFDLSWLIVDGIYFVEVVQDTPKGGYFVLEESALYWEDTS